MPPRFTQVLLVLSLLWLSWLTMMLVHEMGHVLGARATGGRVRQVVWHPLVLSRTDVKPNPRPIVEVWAGPIVGCVVPVLIAACLSLARFRVSYLMWFIAGFCLIANGAYIGVGAIDPVGDAHELVAQETPRWLMAAFGLITFAGGLICWHRVSSRLGFGRIQREIDPVHAAFVFVAALGMTVAALVLGNRGG